MRTKVSRSLDMAERHAGLIDKGNVATVELQLSRRRQRAVGCERL